MKILVVIPTVFGGGAEQVAAILSREWGRAHEVKVLAWQQAGVSLDFGVPVHFANLGVQRGLPGKIWNFFRRVGVVMGQLREFRPDVVMAFMDEVGMPCVMAGALDRSLPHLIVSVHHNPQWIPPWRRMLLGLFYRFPGAVVAVSQGVRDELAQALRLPPIRLRHIPNPLVVDIDPAEAPYAGAAGMPDGYVLSVGRLDRHTKGLDLLITAYASLPMPRPGLVIVGDGPDRAVLEADIARAGMGDEVFFAGWVKDPRPFYRRASVFVLASRYEGWSNVLMEAMGQGCLVVATSCPYGPSEILGESLAACLVAPDDAAALARGMQSTLMLDAPSRERLSSALCARVQCFAADRVAQQWIDLAHSLSGRATP